MMMMMFYSTETWASEETQRIVTGLPAKATQSPYCRGADWERERGTV